MLVPIPNIPLPIAQKIFQHSLLLTEISNQEISGNMQQLLNSHFILYTLRQNLYSLVLNQSHIFKEIYAAFTSITILDVFYYSVFMMTMLLFWKDLSYKRSTKKIVDNGIITPHIVRKIEMCILVIVMILFQDVDNATG